MVEGSGCCISPLQHRGQPLGYGLYRLRGMRDRDMGLLEINHHRCSYRGALEGNVHYHPSNADQMRCYESPAQSTNSSMADSTSYVRTTVDWLWRLWYFMCQVF